MPDFGLPSIATSIAYGRGGYGAQSGARDENGDWVDHSDVSGPGRAEHETQQPIVQDSEADAISKLAQELNIKLDDQTKDYLTQYYFNEKSNQNAWDRTMSFEKDKYSILVQGLQKAGLNPFLALSGLGSGSASSSAGSVQGGLYTSRRNQQTQSNTSLTTSILGILGIIAAAVIHAL